MLRTATRFSTRFSLRSTANALKSSRFSSIPRNWIERNVVLNSDDVNGVGHDNLDKIRREYINHCNKCDERSHTYTLVKNSHRYHYMWLCSRCDTVPLNFYKYDFLQPEESPLV